MNPAKPQVYHDIMSPSAQKVWDWLSKNAPHSEEFELNQSGLAEKMEVSRATISHALKVLISANLLSKTRSKTGRGNGCLFQFIWEFSTESVTSKKKESNQRKNNYYKTITKGSPAAKKFMYNLRKWVEGTHLSQKASYICGSMFNLLEGRPVEKAKLAMVRLKERMMRDWDLNDLYVWLHDFQEAVLASCSPQADGTTPYRDTRTASYRTEKDPEMQKDPPPRMKDFDSMHAYQEAVEEWDGG